MDYIQISLFSSLLLFIIFIVRYRKNINEKEIGNLIFVLISISTSTSAFILSLITFIYVTSNGKTLFLIDSFNQLFYFVGIGSAIFMVITFFTIYYIIIKKKIPSFFRQKSKNRK
jgi:hypothetical protein